MSDGPKLNRPIPFGYRFFFLPNPRTFVSGIVIAPWISISSTGGSDLSLPFLLGSDAKGGGKFWGGNAPMRKVRSFNLRKMKYSWLGWHMPSGMDDHFSDKDDVLWQSKVIISYLEGAALWKINWIFWFGEMGWNISNNWRNERMSTRQVCEIFQINLKFIF